jgi:hypothetical protein
MGSQNRLVTKIASSLAERGNMRILLSSLILLITAAAGGITDKHSNTEASPRASRESIVVDDTKVFNQVRAGQRERFRVHQEAIVLWNTQVEKNRIAAQQAEERRRSETLAKQRATTPTTYVARSSGGNGLCSQEIADLARSIWTKDVDWLLNEVIPGESRCVPTALNPSGAAGLTQMMSVHNHRFAKVCGHKYDFRVELTLERSKQSFWKDPECNLKAAWDLYVEQGRGPWWPH